MSDVTASLGKRLVQTTFWSALVRIAGMAFTFVSGALLARFLGPTAYGIYGTLVALALVLASLVQMGLPQLATREIARHANSGEPAKAKGPLVWFSVFVAASSIVAAVGILTMSALPFGPLSGFSQMTVVFGALLLPLTALSNLCIGMLIGLHRNIAAATQDALVRPALFAVLISAAVVIAPTSFSAASALFLQVTASLASVIFCSFNIIRSLPTAVRQAPANRDFAHWARSALAMGGTDLIRMLDAQVPLFLVAFFLPIEDVGQYRVALATSALVGLPVTFIIFAILSHLTELFAKGDLPRMQKLLAGAAVAATAATVTGTLFLFFFGQVLISVAFGAAYLPAWAPLIGLCIVSCVVSAFTGSAITLNMCGMEREMFTIFAGGLLLNVSIAVVSIPKFGIVGAAVGLIAEEVARCLVMRYLARRRLGVETSLIAGPAFVTQMLRARR